MDELKQLRELEEKISNIYYNSDIPANEKQEQIKEIESQINEIEDRF